MVCNELDSACDVDRHCCGDESDCRESLPAAIVLFLSRGPRNHHCHYPFVLLCLEHLSLIREVPVRYEQGRFLFEARRQALLIDNSDVLTLHRF